MDRGRVDDEGEHAGAAGQRGELGGGLARRDAEVGALVQLEVAGVVEEGRAVPTGSAVASSTTGARSRKTPSSSASKSVSGPTPSQSEVTPPLRSTSAASLAAFSVPAPRRGGRGCPSRLRGSAGRTS